MGESGGGAGPEGAVATAGGGGGGGGGGDAAARIAARFASLGFERLTEIQKKAVPLVLARRSSLFVAPTGSGKTESSVVPIFSMLRGAKRPGKIKVLYITPLRALNRDVFRRITGYAHDEGLEVAIRHGDTSQRDRRRMAENPPDVLITTPETLVILLTQKKYLDALSELEWVVIDEVHELLPSERGAQLTLSLERLQLASAVRFTRIGLSATVGNPGDAARFVAGSRGRFAVAKDTSVREYDVEIQYVDGTVTDVVDAIASHVSGLGLDSPVLLFTNTRGEAEFLAAALRDRSSVRIELHHGSLSREVREETEESLRDGRPGIVVCTSSLELGLDIGSVELVMHYGSPRQVSKLVQRIGRSRHHRGSSAKGVIITNNADDEIEARAIMERIRGGEIEEQKIHSGSLDVLAHHMVGLTLQLGEVAVDECYGMVGGAFSFRDLPREELVAVLDLLDSSGLVLFDRKGMTFRKRGRTIPYHFQNLSTIPDILKFRVFDSVGKRAIGSLDQRFVGDYGEQGNVFVLKGSHWRVVSTDEKSFVVNVEPVRGSGVTVPYWEGENIPVDYATARGVGVLRTRAAAGDLDGVSGGVIAGLRHDGLRCIPDERTLVAESARTDGSVVIHSCMGTRINATLTALLSAMLSAVMGYRVDGRSDAYRIALTSTGRITERILGEVLRDEYDLAGVVSASLTGTHNVNWRTWCVAKKFGVVGRDSVYERKTARFLYERYAGTPLVRESLRELFHDKYDLGGTEAVLRRIRGGDVAVVWRDVDGFSRLAEPILDHTTKYYSNPSSMDKGIMDMVKERLHKTKHRLVCVRCGRWERSVETGQVDFALVCPQCRARQITATYYTDYELPALVRKKRGGGRLTGDEKHRLDRAWKVSSLVESFGRTALLVMSGYGVGADTAARILRDMVEGDEENLYRQIYEAERQYVMTRGFWD